MEPSPVAFAEHVVERVDVDVGPVGVGAFGFRVRRLADEHGPPAISAMTCAWQAWFSFSARNTASSTLGAAVTMP